MRKRDGMQLGDSLPNLLIGRRQLLLVHLGLHHCPFLSWQVGCDEIAPGPCLVGNINRKDFRHGNGGVSCDQPMKQGCPIKWIWIRRPWASEFDYHRKRGVTQSGKEDNIVLETIRD